MKETYLRTINGNRSSFKICGRCHTFIQDGMACSNCYSTQFIKTITDRDIKRVIEFWEKIDQNYNLNNIKLQIIG